MFGRPRRHHSQIVEDSYGLNRTVRDFNRHDGPARIFYNRNSRVFSVSTYPKGTEHEFGEMLDTFDVVELYRKTHDGGEQISKEALKTLENRVGAYSSW